MNEIAILEQVSGRYTIDDPDGFVGIVSKRPNALAALNNLANKLLSLFSNSEEKLRLRSVDEAFHIQLLVPDSEEDVLSKLDEIDKWQSQIPDAIDWVVDVKRQPVQVG